MNKKILHTVFQETAKRFPDNVAVQHESCSISYKSLNSESNRISRYLSDLGVRKDVIVGIFLESGIEYIASILAVMKSGGVFLPLDISFPEKRLKYILDKTTPDVLIIGKKNQDTIITKLDQVGIDQNKCPMIFVDEKLNLYPEKKQYSDIDPETIPDPDDSNYIIYTSGSTGAPKAIVGRHKSLSHFMHWETKEFELDESVKSTQLTPITFDASLRDIFVPLLVGGTVCIPPENILTNIVHLTEWIDTAGVTLIHTVPSLFRMIIQTLESEQKELYFKSLKYVLLAGEALYGKDVIRWKDLVGDRIELVNLYGASETTLIKSFNRKIVRPSKSNVMIPVGQPISNTAILILKDDRLCDIGETGEIFIKTPFRSKGYYNEPEMTKKFFVQNPLNKEIEDIIYKTGDLGRYFPDRSIDFTGRADTQVKVNGIRIELAEIEKALMNNETIDQAVVLAFKNNDNENSLVCYYTEKLETDVEDIRLNLSLELPVYMLPVYYLKMEKFPLNVNGKLDRKALPKHDEIIKNSKKYEPPASDIEKVLAKIWEEVLEIERVSVTSSFFEIGGHSLKATRVVSKIYKELKIEISLKEFFKHSTIRKLAPIVSRSETTSFLQIQPVKKKPYYDLSHAQRRLWIMDQMDDGGGIAYSLPAVYSIDGNLNVSVFCNAFEALIQRHESLRTTFLLVDGEPKQKIHENKNFSFKEIDLSQDKESSDVSKENFVIEYAAKDAKQPFDLSKGPLLRMQLLKLSHERFIVLFNMHHIVSDAWSMDVLAKEVLTLYDAFIKNEANPLLPLRIQYKDYAAWQNTLLNSDKIRKDQTYWRGKLSGDLPVLNLPLDYPRPPVQTFNGNTISFEFDESLTKGLIELSNESDATIFMTVHALLKVLLYRYTGQEDIIIGAPVAGREHFDLDNQIGFYVNLLALRDEIKGDDAFRDILRKVKQTTTEAYEHQVYPFDSLVNEIDTKKDISRPPIFNVAMTFYDNPQVDYETGGIKISPLKTELNVSKYDFIMTFTAKQGRFGFNVNYNSDLFKSDTIIRLGNHFKELSVNVVKDANCSIKHLNILDSIERKKIFSEFNDTFHDHPKDKTIVDLFHDNVKLFPDHTAVIFDDKQITYQELDQKSDLLANYLKKAGVQHEEIVGLMIDRSEMLVISFLGILKSGAVYLPVDPEYPLDRVAHILDDSKCNIILTEEKHISKVNDFKLQIQELSRIFSGNHDFSDITNNSRVITPQSPAYLIYTSGSTGKPKGSMNIHQGPVNMALDQIRSFGISASDQVLQFASCSFDASVYEMCMGLFAGSAVAIVSKERINDPQNFTQYLQDKNITVATLPPVYLNTLNREELVTLKTIITAGEPAIVNDAVYYSKHKQYVNAYGPSEASVCISFHKVDPKREYKTGIPIGKPISNTCIYILDDFLQPVPIGVPGEIAVSGLGLGRGYLNRDDLTREKFIQHPFKSDEKLYMTGDIGKWLCDGNIEFSGRKDDQVKIRGYRIELGEVENRLLGYTGVNEVVVVVSKDLDELVAYVVSDNELNLTRLKSHLTQFLPDYMIPAYFVRIDSIPLTSNGKIDKKALSDPETNYLKTDTEYEVPRNNFETKLIRIWEDVLGKRDIGIKDNFFDLGGNSLHSVKIASRATTELNCLLSVKQIFLNPTVAGISKAMKQDSLKSEPVGRIPVIDVPLNGSKHLSIERRPLITLMAMEEIPPVKSAAIGYLHDELISDAGITRDEVIDHWCNNAPVISTIYQTVLGRIAFITLPKFSSELYSDKVELIKAIQDALKIAGHFGAETLSLTGIIPSATDYGRRIIADDSYNEDELPAVSTGHATTTATVIMSIENILHQANRSLERETVGFLGLGSVGTATLYLMLKCLPHPETLILSDLYTKNSLLKSIKQDIIKNIGFNGTIHIVESSQNVPDEFYDATLIVGATNVPDILDISKINPGTMIVDDSGPHCFKSDVAVLRLKEKKDILFTEGGVLNMPQPYSCTIHIPYLVEKSLNAVQKGHLLNFNPSMITGCVLSGLLSSLYEDLKPTIGNVDIDVSYKNYQKLNETGFTAAGLHCENYFIPDEYIACFRDNFSNKS